MKPNIKILHTADLHLGAKFLKLGSKGSQQRKRLCEVLDDIVNLALQEKVNVVLFAGDTFDSQSPSPESIAAFEFAVSRLRQSGIPVVMIAGTHDCLSERSFLTRYLKDDNSGPVVLHAQRIFWTDERKSMCVQGISLESAGIPKNPLALLHKTPDLCWQIGLAHAALDIGQGPIQEAVFTRDEVKETGMDYLALGHWHRQRDCSVGTTTCWYSGSPEMIALDEGEKGSVLLIELQEKQAPRVTAHCVGKRSVLQLAVEVNDAESSLRQVIAQADQDRVLDLTLTGIVSPENIPDISEIQKRLEPYFYYVQIRNAVLTEFTPEDMKKYSEQTVIGRFIHLVETSKAATSDADQKAELDQALHLGIALLTGHEVLS